MRSKDNLLELGSYFTAQEMLSHLDMPSYSTNIDILHPLARSFCRLNGRADVLEGVTIPMNSVEPVYQPSPLESAEQQPFKNAKVEFFHSMDELALKNRDLTYVKKLKRQARSAAMWQFNRERNFVGP